MDQASMVAAELSKEQIDAGESLVKILDQSGFEPDAAFWFYFPDAEAWKLVLAEAKVGKEGPKEVYRLIQRTLGRMPSQFPGLSLDDIALMKPDAPLVELLRSIIRTGPGISGIRFKNNVINGTVIEDAFIYRIK